MTFQEVVALSEAQARREARAANLASELVAFAVAAIPAGVAAGIAAGFGDGRSAAEFAGAVIEKRPKWTVTEGEEEA